MSRTPTRSQTVVHEPRRVGAASHTTMVLAIVLTILGGFTILGGSAKAEGAIRAFAIPAQALGDALAQFADETDVKLVADATLVQGLQSPGVRGDFTPSEALDRLLAGTPVRHRFLGPDTMTVEPIPEPDPLGRLVDEASRPPPLAETKPEQQGPAKEEAEPTGALPEMTVTGSGLAEGSYSVPNATTATKTDTPIMETPVSVQVVPRAVMDDQQVIGVKDALKNVSGVQPSLKFGTLQDDFIVRGFSTGTNLYRNGLRQRFFGFETANLERIEVLKGPASVLYGRIEPGGLINLVTKRPLANPYYSLEQQFGSYDLYRTTAEATGALNADRTLLYRLDFAFQDSDSFQDFVFLDRVFVAPSVSWQPSSRTRFDLTFEHQDDDLNFSNGIPAIGNRPAPVPIGFSADDGDDSYKVGRELVEFAWSHEFLEGWTVRNRFLAYFYDFESLDIVPSELRDDNRTLDRFLLGFEQPENNTYGVNLDLTGRFDTWGWRHNALVGVDYYRFDQEFVGFCCPDVAPLDIFNPQRGIVDEAAISASTGNNFFSTRRERWYGIYFQDQITLWDRLHVLGGGRYDWAEFGEGFSETSLPETTFNEDEAFSPRVGMVYQPWPWLSLYGHYVESFGSNNGRSATGEPFDPQRGQQYEAGFKTEIWEGRLSSTLAFYHLTLQNILTSDISTPDPTDSIAIGEARSQGIELDVTGQLTDALSLIGSYAFTDARITRDDNGNEGRRFPDVAEHTASVWARYAVTDRFTVGTGIFLASEKVGDIENTFDLPGYVRWDAMAAYRWQLGKSRLTAQVNVNNILDKEYFQSTGDTVRSIIAAEPLIVLGSVRVEF